ncbi:hypothetical protein C8Q76DRAFT_271777 [Earliella scabrosa]|nr:hypothetical protein C8Q76DRAFT_271777 [Earliella scabrosa]
MICDDRNESDEFSRGARWSVLHPPFSLLPPPAYRLMLCLFVLRQESAWCTLAVYFTSGVDYCFFVCWLSVSMHVLYM